MTTRRNFLKALAGTALAPFLPAIAAAPQLDTMPIEEIMAGRVGLMARLGGANGIIESFAPQPVSFVGGVSKAMSFGVATEACTVTHLYLSGWGGEPIKIKLNMYGSGAMMAGDSMHISGLEVYSA